MNIIKTTYRIMVSLGVDPRRIIRGLQGLPRYCLGFVNFRKQRKSHREGFDWGPSFPCLSDWSGESGTARGFYFHQDLLVARKIFLNKPEKHVDVGSRVDGFVAHVASFREIEVIDIRETTASIPNVLFRRADMMGDLDESLRESCDSLSCLHALEHFGLGRYGDPLRYDGHRVGLSNLTAMLKRGGKLYLSFPIGPQRIEFNAHRVFSLRSSLDMLRDSFTLASFSYVDDAGNLFENVGLDQKSIDSNCGCTFGCGIFELVKK